MSAPTLAAVDLGSNSFRLEIGRIERDQIYPLDTWKDTIRFGAGLDRRGAAVQEPSFTDLETLAVLLQHGDIVVSNAGTILLDALANDRPAVCTGGHCKIPDVTACK